jgi:hypothetical protein
MAMLQQGMQVRQGEGTAEMQRQTTKWLCAAGRKGRIHREQDGPLSGVRMEHNL